MIKERVKQIKKFFLHFVQMQEKSFIIQLYLGGQTS